MYKSKLQELCQKKKWGLPKYSGMKDGSDHNPYFKASVVVSGTHFHTPNICKSLKEAYNEAAMLAFLHFSSDGESSYGETSHVEQEVKTMDIDSQVKTIQNDPEPVHGGMEVEQQKFKTKLQMYAQRKNLVLPSYHSTREGPPNSLCFRSTVTVGGDSFESPGSYKTIKQADNAAAQVALMALSTDAFQENDIWLYKNLLQEFAQMEGFFMPWYKAARTGEAHDPTFFATVEVEGETFHGNPSKSKKEAELNAAKVAYTTFMQRKSCRSGDPLSSSSKDESFKLAPCLNSLNLADFRGKSPQKDDFSSSSSADEIVILTPQTSSHRSINLRGNPKSIYQTGSASTMKYEAQTLASKDTSAMEMEMTTEIKSYMLNNRIRVYTSIPDVAFPNGNIGLPISEDKWVVVSLEFPNYNDT